MSAGWRHVMRLLLMLALGWHAVDAAAHEMSIAEMTVREVGSGQFVWSWGAPGKSKPIAEELTPNWPQHLDQQQLPKASTAIRQKFCQCWERHART